MLLNHSNSMIDAPTGVNVSAEKTRWFMQEVQTHEARLKSYLRGAFPAVDVEDIAQESFLRVWLADVAQPIKSAKAFLFTVARRLALDSIRHQKKSPIIAVPDLAATGVMDEGRDAAEAAAASEEIALLADALDALPPRCREIIILRKFHFIPQRDVAARLGISENTVEEQVYRGIRRMEKFLIKRGVIKPRQDKS